MGFSITAWKNFKSGLFIGRLIGGRYSLERLIGTGSTTRVYLARDIQTGRRLALKIQDPELRNCSKSQNFFLREINAGKRLKHPNIIEMYAFGKTEDGLSFIVMELLDGIRLFDEILKGPMPVSLAVQVIDQVCGALGVAHNLGVIHQDVQDKNVFLQNRGGRSNFAKLFDFGSAMLFPDPRTAEWVDPEVFSCPTNSSVQSMSPEQARWGRVTAQSDLYSLGILFYQIVTGRLPFDSPNPWDIIELHISMKPLAPSQIIPSIGTVADSIILRLLAKAPEDRYRDARHLQEDLKALMR